MSLLLPLLLNLCQNLYKRKKERDRARCLVFRKRKIGNYVEETFNLIFASEQGKNEEDMEKDYCIFRSKTMS